MPLALVTGTSGFVGRHIADALRSTHDVLEVQRRPAVLGHRVARWDLTEPLPANLPAEVDLVVHAAATDGRQSATPAATCFQVNTLATERLLEYAADAGARQFVYLSTGSVYPKSEAPLRESDAIAPVEPYAATKAAAECLVSGYAGRFVPLVLRLFYPYGPGQRPPRLLPAMIDRIACGLPVPLHGEAGAPRINPLYIDDAIAWMLALIRQNASGVFNLAGDESLSIRSLAERIATKLSRPVTFQLGAELPGDLVGDNQRVRRATGISPGVSLDQGLTRMLAALPPHDNH